MLSILQDQLSWYIVVWEPPSRYFRNLLKPLSKIPFLKQEIGSGSAFFPEAKNELSEMLMLALSVFSRKYVDAIRKATFRTLWLGMLPTGSFAWHLCKGLQSPLHFPPSILRLMFWLGHLEVYQKKVQIWVSENASSYKMVKHPEKGEVNVNAVEGISILHKDLCIVPASGSHYTLMVPFLDQLPTCFFLWYCYLLRAFCIFLTICWFNLMLQWSVDELSQQEDGIYHFLKLR